MSKLTNTIRTEVDEDYFMDIADFRDYARSMMFPDPVGIDMSDELNDMVTEAVNSGKTTLEDSFKKLVKRDAKGRIDYSYSDGFDGFSIWSGAFVLLRYRNCRPASWQKVEQGREECSTPWWFDI